MDVPDSLKWAVQYRGMAAGAFVVGGLLVGIGVVLGLQGFVSALVSDPLNPTEAVDEANPLLTIAFTLLGLVVWRIGKTYALFVTLPQATGRAAAESFDTERVKSDVLEVLDERLSEMQVEVERTRQQVERLQRAEHAASFDESDALESPGGRSKSGSNGATSAADSNGAASSAATASSDSAPVDGTDDESSDPLA